MTEYLTSKDGSRIAFRPPRRRPLRTLVASLTDVRSTRLAGANEAWEPAARLRVLTDYFLGL